jgi:hypothetical protein
MQNKENNLSNKETYIRNSPAINFTTAQNKTGAGVAQPV